MQGPGVAGGHAESTAGRHQALQRAGAPPVQLRAHGATALQTRESSSTWFAFIVVVVPAPGTHGQLEST